MLRPGWLLWYCVWCYFSAQARKLFHENELFGPSILPRELQRTPESLLSCLLPYVSNGSLWSFNKMLISTKKIPLLRLPIAEADVFDVQINLNNLFLLCLLLATLLFKGRIIQSRIRGDAKHQRCLSRPPGCLLPARSLRSYHWVRIVALRLPMSSNTTRARLYLTWRSYPPPLLSIAGRGVILVAAADAVRSRSSAVVGRFSAGVDWLAVEAASFHALMAILYKQNYSSHAGYSAMDC